MNSKLNINGGKLYRKTADLVSPSVNRFIQLKIKSLGLGGDLESLLLELPRRREGKHLLRPTLAYLTYQVFGGQESLEGVLPALAVSELNNDYCYLDNWILDDKSGIGSNKEKIRQITIASQMLRDLTQQVIEESELSANKKRDISEQVAKTTMKCYEGQFQDLQMTVDSLAKYPSDEEYLNAYREKSSLQSGDLYGLSGEIGAVIASAGQEQITLARDVCKTLGTGIHISCDLGDFAPFILEDGSFKLYQDQMADIRNGRLTYPTYYVLKNGSPIESRALRDLIGNISVTEQEMLMVSEAILTSGAFEAVKSMLKNYYHNFKHLVHQLPACPERDAISSVGKIIKENKYLAALKKLNRRESLKGDKQ
jgi:geranylgeranyl pyrophosphate synthase